MGGKGQMGRPPVDSEDIHVRLRRSALDALTPGSAHSRSPARSALRPSGGCSPRRWGSRPGPTSNRQRCRRHQARSYEFWGIDRRTAAERQSSSEPAGLLGFVISIPISTFRLYRAAAVLRMLVVAFRLWLSGFQPVSREGGSGLGGPPGPRCPFVRAPPCRLSPPRGRLSG